MSELTFNIVLNDLNILYKPQMLKYLRVQYYDPIFSSNFQTSSSRVHIEVTLEHKRITNTNLMTKHCDTHNAVE